MLAARFQEASSVTNHLPFKGEGLQLFMNLSSFSFKWIVVLQSAKQK
jgi:hypothetical protein